MDAAGQGLDDGEVIARLSTLSPIEYDRVRETEAEALGVRVGTLDAEVKKARGEGEDEEFGWLRSFRPRALADGGGRLQLARRSRDDDPEAYGFAHRRCRGGRPVDHAQPRA